MDPLLIIRKCKPHPIALVANPFPSRTMIIFAEEAIFIVGLDRDLIATISGSVGSLFGEAGELVGDLIGGQLSDWRATRNAREGYEQFSQDMERYVAAQKSAHRFEYDQLQKLIVRKNLPWVVGVGEYIGFRFDEKSYYFDVKEKHVVDAAVTVVEDRAPHARVKRKSGPMLTRG